MDQVENTYRSPRTDRLWFESEAPTRISDEQRKVLRDKKGFEGYTAYFRDYKNKDLVGENLLSAWNFAEGTPAGTIDKTPILTDAIFLI